MHKRESGKYLLSVTVGEELASAIQAEADDKGWPYTKVLRIAALYGFENPEYYSTTDWASEVAELEIEKLRSKPARSRAKFGQKWRRWLTDHFYNGTVPSELREAAASWKAEATVHGKLDVVEEDLDTYEAAYESQYGKNEYERRWSPPEERTDDRQ